jgi:bla regulator protein blaR1
MHSCSWLVAIVAVAGVALGAQSGDAKFEVASIKPNKSGSNRVNVTPQPGGRFTAINVSTMDLIAFAYGDARPFPRTNILGVPSWVSVERFDIVAKADGNPTQEEFSPLLRSLLAERFRMAAHLETRERPVYTLMLARRDGSLGPSLRPSSLNCAGARETLSAGCEMLSVPGVLKARGTPIAALTRLLTGWVEDHREVRDETGLTGTFDMEMRWTPDRAAPIPPEASPELRQALLSVDPNGPSLLTALQEQLGLKLVAGRDQTDVLVIDHVEHPSPD